MRLLSKNFIFVDDNGWKIQEQTGNWRGAARWNERTVYAVGDDGYYLTTSDGVSWTKRQFVINNNTYDYNAVVCPDYYATAWVGDTILQVGYSGVTTPPWVEITSGINWNAVAYGNNKYVAVGNGGYLAYATAVNTGQTLTWTITNSKLGVLNDPYCVGYINDLSKFIAAGDNGYVTSSQNLTTWTTPTQINSNITWVSIATNGTYIFMLGNRVAGGGTSYIAKSIDGISWEVIKTLSGYYLRAMTFANNQLIVCGRDGVIGTSTNGADWTFETTNPAANWYGIADGEFGFMVAGTNYVGYKPY